MARRSRRNRRRSRGRFAFLYRLLCFVLICAAIVGALVLFFKVDTISVSGNDRYSRETILAASGVSEGDNLFLLNKYDAAARITEALPYVESVRLSRKLPGTLRIDIVECSDPAGIQQDGHCWLISPEGKLVDSPAEAPNGCPMVVGLSLTDPQAGSLAAVPEEQSGDLARLLEIGDTPFGDNTSVARLEAEGDDIRVLYRDDNSHLVQAGLSTLAKQKWWRQKGVQEMGQLYAPLTEEERQQLGVPTGGEGVAVRFVDELIGAYQLLPRPEEGVGEIGWYGLLPQWQGRDQGIQPLGQIIQRCRHMGLLRLRLRCGDDRQRSFWEKLGFSPVGGDVMEKDITPRVLDAHIPL